MLEPHNRTYLWLVAVYACCGQTLVQTGRVDNASHCLSMLTACGKSTKSRPRALYDIACVVSNPFTHRCDVGVDDVGADMQLEAVEVRVVLLVDDGQLVDEVGDGELARVCGDGGHDHKVGLFRRPVCVLRSTETVQKHGRHAVPPLRCEDDKRAGKQTGRRSTSACGEYIMKECRTERSALPTTDFARNRSVKSGKKESVPQVQVPHCKCVVTLPP